MWRILRRALSRDNFELRGAGEPMPGALLELPAVWAPDRGGTGEAAAGYAPPGYADGLVVTHVLELNQDLRVPSGFRMMLAHEPTPEESVLPVELRRMLFEVPAEDADQLGEKLLSTRLHFWRQPVKAQMPLQAADLAAAEWTRELMSEEQWRAREASLQQAVENLIFKPVSVVAVTRILRRDRWPESQAEQQGVLEDELDAGIDFLNEFLLSLALVTRDLRMRPIARGDLPALCPVIIEAFPMQEGRRVGVAFLREIHRQMPTQMYEADLSQDVVTAAAELTTFQRQGVVPFFLFYELMHTALVASAEHRYSESVISSGTAAEVLINTVIREASLMLGEDATRRDGILAAPFINRVTHHVPRYTGIAVDLQARQTPFGRWYQSAYLLRNEVVHGGTKPGAVTTQEACDAVSALAVALRDALRSRPDTELLGQQLEWGPPSDRADWDRSLGLI
jgi:hypothetical protein